MKILSSLAVGVKLIGGYVLVAAAVVAVAALGSVSLGSLNAGMTTLYEDRVLPIKDLGQANALLYRLRGDVYKYGLLPDERAATLSSITTTQTEFEEALNQYRATFLVPEEVAGLADLDIAWTDTRP